MAPTANPCWTLVLGACLALTVRADCEKECELCVYRLQDRQTDLNLATCVQECEGSEATTKSLDLCSDALRGNLAEVLRAEDAGRLADGQPEQLAKRYGDLAKKSAEEVGAETAGGPGKRHGGFPRKELGVLKELLAAAAREGGDGTELGGGGKALQKRYGGFMRRVGSPNWEENKKIYEGLVRRSWGTEGEAGSPEKRYGGFMD